jgi:hypothetical protein
MGYNYEKEDSNHEKFLIHLNNSSEAVFVVAKYLYLKGLDVRINALKKSKSHSEWKKFKDDGDLFIYHKKNKYRIEVKGLSCDFTDDKDWAFKDFIVCAKHSYDNAKLKPYAYFILNKNKTHIGRVKSSTKHNWNVVSRKDNRYKNVKQEFYTCELSDIEWINITPNKNII